MIIELLAISVIIFLMIIASLWGYLRSDIASLAALSAIMIFGLISPEEVFSGFSHPAVIVVASMFVISQALIQSGVIDVVIRRLTYIERHPLIKLLVLSSLVAGISAFINGVGALALALPIAVHLAKQDKISPSIYFLPLAFASHLGGFLTLVGTPRNIIVSSFRESAGLEPFAMFDFAYVGIFIAVASLIFLSFIGWLLLPKRRGLSDLGVEVEDYVAEVKIPKDQKYLVEYINNLRASISQPFKVVAIIRGVERILKPSGLEEVQPEDNLLIQADSDTLTNLVEVNKLSIVGQKAAEGKISQDDETIDIEAVVQPRSFPVGLSWQDINLNLRFGINFLALSRTGETIDKHLVDVHFRPGDVLLLSGRRDSLVDTINWLKLLPLAEREVSFGRSPKVWLSSVLFIVAIVLAALNILPIEVIFLTTAVLMVVIGLISWRQSYESIDWPVIILLGSMIALGSAFEDTGGAEMVAGGVEYLIQYISPVAILVTVFIITMLLSDFINTTAAAVLMSPVAVLVASSLGASIDPFLMAVAIGASCAFLTPMGHESNMLVMGPGGYRFSDYLKVGLPLEILITVLSIPLLLYFWPLF
ncbi:MAG: SLC13 family permease [Patescibacteria group bacterium]